jgi:hypothetical protein
LSSEKSIGTRQTAAGLNHVDVHGIDQGLWTQSQAPLTNFGLLPGQAVPYLPYDSALNPGGDQGGNTVSHSSSIESPGNFPTEFSQAWSNGNSSASTSHFLTNSGEGPVNAAATFHGAAVANNCSYDVGFADSGDALQGQFATIPFDGNFQPLNGNDPGFGLDFSLPMLAPLTMDIVGQSQMAFSSNAAITAAAVTSRAFDDGPGPSMLMPSMLMPPTSFSDAQHDAVYPPFTSTGNSATASLSTSISAPMLTPLASAAVRRVRPAPRVRCTHLGCTQTFKRDADRVRHENTKHRNNHGQHLCPIVGCPKSHGRGFCRPDKVTEHLWRVHSDLGYTKKA